MVIRSGLLRREVHYSLHGQWFTQSLSGMYWALLLVLFALFLRPVGFDYRSKLENTKWRNSWDWGLCIGGAVPALVFGVAFGNLF